MCRLKQCTAAIWLCALLQSAHTTLNGSREISLPRFRGLSSPTDAHPLQRSVGHPSSRVKMTLAYVYTLFYGHQGFRPIGPRHKKATGYVGPPAASIHVSLLTIKQHNHIHKHSRPHRSGSRRWSTDVTSYYSGLGNVWRWAKPLI